MNTVDQYGDNATLLKIIDRSIDEFIDDTITTVGGGAFYQCSSMRTLSLPSIVSARDFAFANCSALTSLEFPSLESVGLSALSGCASLETVALPKVRSIANYGFYNCSALTKLILGNETLVTLNNRNALQGANNAVIYVPDALVDSYKSATNWSTYASRIKGISELPA